MHACVEGKGDAGVVTMRQSQHNPHLRTARVVVCSAACSCRSHTGRAIRRIQRYRDTRAGIAVTECTRRSEQARKHSHRQS